MPEALRLCSHSVGEGDVKMASLARDGAKDKTLIFSSCKNIINIINSMPYHNTLKLTF